MSERSEVGQGDQCAIYALGDAEQFCDGVVGAHNQTAMCSSVGEDYSTSHWDVVVKAKRSVSKDALLQQLRDLVGALDSEASFYQDVSPAEESLFRADELISGLVQRITTSAAFSV